MMNSINLIGRLTKDPEMKKSADGLSICTFSLAMDDHYSKESRTDFVRICTFGKQAENCEKYLRKGFMAGATGRVRSDNYIDSEGHKRFSWEVIADRVIFLQWPDTNQAQ